jgi:hypothetical protein
MARVTCEIPSMGGEAHVAIYLSPYEAALILHSWKQMPTELREVIIEATETAQKLNEGSHADETVRGTRAN